MNTLTFELQSQPPPFRVFDSSLPSLDECGGELKGLAVKPPSFM